MAEAEHGGDRRWIVWLKVIGAVAAVAALGVAILQYMLERKQGEDRSGFDMTVELRQYDSSKGIYFDSYLKTDTKLNDKRYTLNRSKITNNTWIKITLIKKWPTSLVVRNIGIISDTGKKWGYWKRDLDHLGIDCSGNRDIRCSSFPMALSLEKEYVTFWPLSETVDALLKVRPGRPIVIGVGVSSPTNYRLHLVNTGLVVSR